MLNKLQKKLLDFIKKGQFPSIDLSADTGNELKYKGFYLGEPKATDFDYASKALLT